MEERFLLAIAVAKFLDERCAVVDQALVSSARAGMISLRKIGMGFHWQFPTLEPVLLDAHRSRLLALENASIKEPLGQCTGTVVFSGNRPAIVSVLLSEELLFSLLWVSVALCSKAV